jgi:catechol 2,3-dioxygenase-like lactoylglutathione lyase family enzyme
MSQTLALVSLLVRDYDEAIGFYVGRLGFDLTEDTAMGPDKRWVVVTPPSSQAGLLLARAAETQTARIGDQAGGRVFLFLHTEDFERDHARMTAAGVRFIETPRREPYGTVAVFEDLYGNRWDLLQRI